MLTEKSALDFALGLIKSEYERAVQQHNDMTIDPARQAWILTREYAEFVRETDLMLRHPPDGVYAYSHKTNQHWTPRKAELIQVAATAAQILVKILQIEEVVNNVKFKPETNIGRDRRTMGIGSQGDGSSSLMPGTGS